MRLLLHDNFLSERGTTNALEHYAAGLSKRGHDVTVAYRASNDYNVKTVVDRFAAQFDLFGYSHFRELQAAEGVWDAAYFIKSGERDGRDLMRTPMFVHAVFQHYDPHGASYEYVSAWLAEVMKKKAWWPRNAMRAARASRRGCLDAAEFRWVPHCADMPSPQSDVRCELGIPDDAFLMLRYGARTTFDVPWVHEVVLEKLEQSESNYFVGINTEPFTHHPRALFLPPVFEDQQKADLLATSQVFLHARRSGESFGLALLEALQSGVPILSWSGGVDRNHNHLLEGTDCLFSDRKDLSERLLSWSPARIEGGLSFRLARGDEYRPSKVVGQLEDRLLLIAQKWG